MKVSLIEFLQTGFLGDLRPGMSKDEVRVLLGEPDAIGGMSRKYPQGHLFLYGTVEIYFQHQQPYQHTSVFWDAQEKSKFQLSSKCKITDWFLEPGMSVNRVEAFLREYQLAFEYKFRVEEEPLDIVLPSGITIGFSKQGLYVIGNAQRIEKSDTSFLSS